jgi:lysophospholipase L1-like esterase
MMTPTVRRVLTVLLLILAASTDLRVAGQTDQWTSAMAAFARQDREAPPASGGIVFVGSSSIRLWDLGRSFPNLPVTNRGFGGSHISDSVKHAELLVIKHKPRTIVFYAGDNDIAAGKPSQQVADDFKAFVAKVHAVLPKTRIAFIGIKPSLLRWNMREKMREANTLIRRYCEGDDRLGFVDTEGAMLGWDEKPRQELFVDDGLHLTPRGYELWTSLVRPFLE